jgi:hypothetical protein
MPLRREAGATHRPVGEDRLVDRGYEGDSGYLAHLGSAAGTDHWDAGSIDRGGDRVERGGDDAAAGVTRRLQARLDRHIWLLERLQAEQLYPEPPGLPELQDTARRMRRDAESLLLLAGHEPGVPSPGPRRLGDLLSDAAAVAEEPRRVEVRSAPAALVAPAAAVEFVHVLAELVDHVTAVYPGARIELVSHLETPPGRSVGNGGATVDALVDGAARHDPDGLGGRRAAVAAEQLARCSRHGIALRRPSGGPPRTGSGLVASVHCPPAAVTVEEPALPRPELRLDRTGLSSYDFGLDAGRRANGTNGSGSSSTTTNARGSSSTASNSTGSNSTASNAAAPSSAAPSSAAPNPAPSNPAPSNPAPSNPAASSPAGESTNGSARPSLSFDEAPAFSPSSSSQIDELFGPLLDLPLEPIDDRYATPIFEAIASAWFREDESGGAPGPGRSGPLDWETPQDDEWREAAARAARSEPEPPTTSSGLPRRRPGNQLVPPPRGTERNGQNGTQQAAPTERAPDRVRDRLSTYQRGLREGRHRAVGSEGGPEPEDR